MTEPQANATVEALVVLLRGLPPQERAALVSLYRGSTQAEEVREQYDIDPARLAELRAELRRAYSAARHSSVALDC